MTLLWKHSLIIIRTINKNHREFINLYFFSSVNYDYIIFIHKSVHIKLTMLWNTWTDNKTYKCLGGEKTDQIF